MFQIDPDSTRPIYQQVVEQVLLDIKRGRLKPGDRLPTVRELAANSNVSSGTIKHAYDELEKMGAISMKQGRGTFVNDFGANADADSKREAALRAVDRYISAMEQIGFTSKETEAFVNLRIKERSQEYRELTVAAVDCNPEALTELVSRLSGTNRIRVFQFLLEDAIARPEKLVGVYDLVVTTYTHYQRLVDEIGALHNQIVRVAVFPSSQTLEELSGVCGESMGIWCVSAKFAQIAQEVIRQQHIGCGVAERLLVTDSMDLDDFLKDKGALLIPSGFQEFLTLEHNAALRRFSARGGKVVVFRYEMDKGSIIHLSEVVNNVWLQKYEKYRD